MLQVADDNTDDPFFQALMQLTDTNKKVNENLVILVCLLRVPLWSKMIDRCISQLIPWSHSYCLSLPLCLEWYNGSITPRVHSGVTKRIDCRLYYQPSATVE